MKFDLMSTECYSVAPAMSIKSLGQRSAIDHSHKVCVIFPGALGDFVCFLPALQSLLREARIDLFSRAEFAELVPNGVTVRSLESAEITSLFVDDAIRARAAQVYFGAFDAVYSWLGSQEPGFVKRLQTFTNQRAKVFPFRPLTIEHQADYYLRCLAAVELSRFSSAIPLRPEAIAWRNRYWRENSLDHKAVLTLAPGSGAREKNWPEEYFLKTVTWWRARTRGNAILLVGPVELERGGIERLQSSCLVARDLTLSQVSAVLERSRLFLGNDSGITHLAAAVGVATIALFGPSDSRQWAPRGRSVTVVRRQMECAPCSVVTMKSCPDRACLTELYTEKLLDVITQLPEMATLTRWGAGITV